MGPHTFAEIEGAYHLPACEADDSQQATVRARLANSSITVNRHEGPFPIRRRRHFMASNAILRDRCDLTAGHRINDPERLVSFVGNQEQPAPSFAA
jgi:hypothetical protein